MARKTMSFGQLLDYLNQPAEIGSAFLQNFRTMKDSQSRIHGEFLENSRLLSPRRNGNILYHEILSFSDLDRERITTAILEDLTRYYLSLRAPYALAYAKAHFNTNCPHVHLIVSANDFGSTRRRRLSRSQFQKVKSELERYQQERYPFLAHSSVLSRQKRGAKARRRSEGERSRRLLGTGDKIPTRKEELRQIVLRMLTVSSSGEVFRQRLEGEGIRIRCRGKTVTLEDRPESGGRRYRLSTLGLEEPFWSAVRHWEALPRRVQSALSALGREQFRQRCAEPESREVFVATIQIEPRKPVEKSIEDRLTLLRQLEIERSRGGERDR